VVSRPGSLHGVNRRTAFAFRCGAGGNPPAPEHLIELKKRPGIERRTRISCIGRQGVLLLNATLTVEAGRAAAIRTRAGEVYGRHRRCAQREREGLVLCLGSYAQKRGLYRTRKTGAQGPILRRVGASRIFGCRHFSKINDYLQHQGKAPIDGGCRNSRPCNRRRAHLGQLIREEPCASYSQPSSSRHRGRRAAATRIQRGDEQ